MPLMKDQTTKMKSVNIKSTVFKHATESREEYVRDICLPMNGSRNWDKNERALTFQSLFDINC